MSLPRAFASDNTAPAHPRVLEMLREVNTGRAVAYGDDYHSEQVRTWFRSLFGAETESFLVWNGSGANVVALRALVRPWQAVVCTEQAHVNVDECGALELLAGCKLIGLPSTDGKVRPGQIDAVMARRGDQHAVQPRVLAITQSTEAGTVYTRAELTELCRVAHSAGLLVFMDGARIANATAALQLPVRAITRDAGVDVLSFGGTKNGAMGAEAVIVFDPALAQEIHYIRKQSLQLASKARFLAAQFLALADQDLWLRNAEHSNAMASRLARGLRGIPAVSVTQPVDANAVFASLPADAITVLQRDFHFYVWNEDRSEVRWMTNWATSEADVDEFLAAIRAACGSRVLRTAPDEG